MKKNPFEILQIRELPSSIVRDDEVTKEEVAKSRLSFLIVFQHQEGNEAVALHVSLRYQVLDGAVLLQEGATLVAKISGWEGMSKDETSLRSNDSVISLVDYGLAFVGGMIYRHVAGSVLNSVLPPHMDAASIMQYVVIDAKPNQAVATDS
ncbi:MAG: hypothetical protein J5965_26990 [Aeriscardovia sp.]|jgi:hypothetical protein|nr:hypothetical protein [Aeriscardovia sp.]